MPEGMSIPSCSKSSPPRSGRQPLTPGFPRAWHLWGNVVLQQFAWHLPSAGNAAGKKAGAGRSESWLQDPAELPKQTASSVGTLASPLPPRCTKSVSAPSGRGARIASEIQDRLNLELCLPRRSRPQQSHPQWEHMPPFLSSSCTVTSSISPATLHATWPKRAGLTRHPQALNHLLSWDTFQHNLLKDGTYWGSHQLRAGVPVPCSQPTTMHHSCYPLAPPHLFFSTGQDSLGLGCCLCCSACMGRGPTPAPHVKEGKAPLLLQPHSSFL